MEKVLMNFGDAIKALKAGFKVSRLEWNNTGIFLTYYSPVIHCPKHADGIETSNGTYPLLAHFLMKTTDDMFVPWSPSQTDVLAEDWLLT